MPSSLVCCLVLGVVLPLHIITITAVACYVDIRTLPPTSPFVVCYHLVAFFAHVLSVGERDDAMAVFGRYPTVGEWHIIQL